MCSDGVFFYLYGRWGLLFVTSLVHDKMKVGTCTSLFRYMIHSVNGYNVWGLPGGEKNILSLCRLTVFFFFALQNIYSIVLLHSFIL